MVYWSHLTTFIQDESIQFVYKIPTNHITTCLKVYPGFTLEKPVFCPGKQYLWLGFSHYSITCICKPGTHMFHFFKTISLNRSTSARLPQGPVQLISLALNAGRLGATSSKGMNKVSSSNVLRFICGSRPSGWPSRPLGRSNGSCTIVDPRSASEHEAKQAKRRGRHDANCTGKFEIQSMHAGRHQLLENQDILFAAR